MKVTFDADAWQPVVRPQLSSGDPSHAEHCRLHEAARQGAFSGFLVRTLAEVEFIKGFTRAAPPADRASPSLAEAIAFGFRLLWSPSVFEPRFPVTDDITNYAFESSEDMAARERRMFPALLTLESRLLGKARLKRLYRRLEARSRRRPATLTSLLETASSEELAELAAAARHNATDTAIACHIGCGNDIFCTPDDGLSPPPILDPENRAYLTARFGLRFASWAELAKLVA